ncbi:hypothetical protein Acr_21g0006080 [Actinidia rufa]|uniref:FAF domain-containing protein n=1 Tax=Actinidia rufa TaxID=165716 RepID=A0A7J0GGS0_9ERIC|nr:hypothetical protein Acr_21g0006080 [Actinidia rufa]
MGDLIGTESGVYMSSNEEKLLGEVDETKSYTNNINQRKRNKGIGTKREKNYPPPIHSLARTGYLTGRMPWVLSRRYVNGRLILREERVNRYEYFEVHRENGRLRLNLIPLDDTIPSCCPVEEENEDVDEHVEVKNDGDRNDRGDERNKKQDEVEEEKGSRILLACSRNEGDIRRCFPYPGSAISNSARFVSMDTRGKSNTEFRNEVYEVLARRESSFDQIHATLQTILTDLQALKAQTNISTTGDVNPFAVGDASQSTKPYPQPRTPNSTLKLYFPKFTGEDPTGWIYRAEQYFEFQGIVPAQRVQLASFHLEGIALQWHPLTRLKHTTTVSAYQEEFEKLSQLIDALPDSHLIGIFIAGLKDEVHLDVKLKYPRTLSEAIGVARLVEERNSLQKKPIADLLGPPPHLKNTPVAETSPPPFKRITNQEARIRQEKGLCFYCDEKYRPGHRCNKPQLFMIENSLFLEPHAESHIEPPPPKPDPNPIKPLISPNRKIYVLLLLNSSVSFSIFISNWVFTYQVIRDLGLDWIGFVLVCGDDGADGGDSGGWGRDRV